MLLSKAAVLAALLAGEVSIEQVLNVDRDDAPQAEKGLLRLRFRHTENDTGVSHPILG